MINEKKRYLLGKTKNLIFLFIVWSHLNNFLRKNVI